MRFLRWLLTYAAFVIGLPFLLGHPKLRRGFRARVGLYRGTFSALAPGPRIWIHGASAGDVLALRPTAERLREIKAEARIVASTITDSGHAMAKREGRAFDAITYSPYDLPGAVRRALNNIAPRVLVLEYTELWPELIDAAQRRGVRIVLHNGRFSAERLNGYRRLFWLTGNLLERFELLLMRDEYEAERALRLGAPEARVHVTGNTKFDNLADAAPAEKVGALRQALGFPDDAQVWVAGSTHEGEEEHVLQVFADLRTEFPALRLVIAPRYIERADRVSALALRHGLRVRRRSQPPGEADLVLLDSIGELSACYGLATLVFVGGSFVRRGGQNILEPAAAGKPVIFGPFMHNFSDAVQVLLGRGGIQVASPEQLARVMADLLRREPYRDELGALAKQQVSSVKGAARRNAELIARIL